MTLKDIEFDHRLNMGPRIFSKIFGDDTYRDLIDLIGASDAHGGINIPYASLRLEAFAGRNAAALNSMLTKYVTGLKSDNNPALVTTFKQLSYEHKNNRIPKDAAGQISYMKRVVLTDKSIRSNMKLDLISIVGNLEGLSKEAHERFPTLDLLENRTYVALFDLYERIERLPEDRAYLKQRFKAAFGKYFSMLKVTPDPTPASVAQDAEPDDTSQRYEGIRPQCRYPAAGNIVGIDDLKKARDEGIIPGESDPAALFEFKSRVFFPKRQITGLFDLSSGVLSSALNRGTVALSEFEKKNSYMCLLTLEKWAYQTQKGRRGILRENLPRVLAGIVPITQRYPDDIESLSARYARNAVASAQPMDSGYAEVLARSIELERQLGKANNEIINLESRVEELMYRPVSEGTRSSKDDAQSRRMRPTTDTIVGIEGLRRAKEAGIVPDENGPAALYDFKSRVYFPKRSVARLFGLSYANLSYALKRESLALSAYEKEKGYISLLALEKWANDGRNGMKGIIRDKLQSVLSGLVQISANYPKDTEHSAAKYSQLTAGSAEPADKGYDPMNTGRNSLEMQLEAARISLIHAKKTLTDKDSEIIKLEAIIAQRAKTQDRKGRVPRYKTLEIPSMKESSTIAELKLKMASLEEEVAAYKDAEELRADVGLPDIELDPQTTGTIEDWYERGFELAHPNGLRRTAVIDGQAIYSASDLIHLAIRTSNSKLQQAVIDFLSKVPNS
jgi:hypothetical protein